MTVPRLPSGLARNRVFFRSSAYAGGTLNSATLSKLSPSYKFMMPNLAPQTRVAFSSIAWNTGSSSPGRPEQRIEHGLKVKCRTTDDLEHIGSRRPLLERF